MRKFLFFICLTCSTYSLAAPYVYSPSASLTTGPVSLPDVLQAVLHNPASGELVVNKKERIRMGYLSTIGGGYEFGQVDNFEEDLDDLINILGDDGASDSTETAQETLDRFNAILSTMGEDGFIKFEASLSFPFSPLVIRITRFGGTFAFDLATDLQIKLSFLDDELSYNKTGGEFETNSAVYLKSGAMIRGGFGFSRPVWTRNVGKWQGMLLAGTKANIYSASLSKQVFGLALLGGEDIGDVISDEYDNGQATTTAVGLDVGLIWVANKYHLGLTVTNLNEPEFDYGVLGTNCSEVEVSASQDNCFVASLHAQALKNINSHEVHTMNALTTVDASYLVKPNLAVSFSYELAEYNDLVGDENQWMVMSASYYPRGGIVPAMRMGYHVNQTGTELSSISFGTTLFKIFNFDFEWGLESIDVDGSSVPRIIGINFGFEEYF